MARRSISMAVMPELSTRARKRAISALENGVAAWEVALSGMVQYRFAVVDVEN